MSIILTDLSGPQPSGIRSEDARNGRRLTLVVDQKTRAPHWLKLILRTWHRSAAIGYVRLTKQARPRSTLSLSRQPGERGAAHDNEPGHQERRDEDGFPHHLCVSDLGRAGRR